MEVSVERYQRKKYVNQENSPVLYYIRQKREQPKLWISTRWQKTSRPIAP